MPCTRDSDVSGARAIYRSQNCASNAYSHFTLKHSEIYAVINPLIESRKCNKREAPTRYSESIGKYFTKSRQNRFDENTLRLFSSPDVPKALSENVIFKELIKSANFALSFPIRKTIDSRLLDVFHATIKLIRSEIPKAEFVAVTFDGWSTSRSGSVIGFMVSTTGEQLNLKTRCVGKFRMNEGHRAED